MCRCAIWWSRTMGNKKRKQSSEAAPKITYGLSRSMIEQQQLKSASLIVPSSPTSVVTPSKSQKKKRKKSSDSQSTENLRKDSYCNNSPTEVSQNELETEQVHDINFMEKEGPAPMPTIGSESIESTEYIQFNVGESRTGAIVYTSQSRILHVSGMCTVKLLSGKGNINGYRLRIGEEISIQSPPWVPAIRLFFEPMMSTEVSNKRMVRELVNTSSYLQPHQETLMKTLTSSMGIIEIISVDLACQNWMIRCEDYSKYKSTNTRSGSLLFLDSAVIGESSDLNTLGLDSQILPTDWVISGDLFCKAIKSAPRAVIFGAKGVGKSTTLRYLINRVLSKTPYVAVLDCDIGQPEFTPSGFLSLHILTQKHPLAVNNPNSFIPLLSPPHLHLHKPDFSFYLGDNTIKNLPEAFESCILSLYEKYQLYSEFYQITGRIPQDPNEVTHENIQEYSHTSNFHLLSHESDEIQFPLPLIVNTDGMLKGMGIEIQRTILNVIKPTHVFHIQLQKDKILVPLEEIQQDSENKLHISILTPGRTTASRLAAQDLRDIRLISYFLYNNPYLKEVTDLSPTPPIHIRNGVCVDYLGHIPTALMHSYEEAVPISKTCFHLIASTIPPRLLLAAFNVSLVGITTSLIESLPHVQGDRIQASYRTTQLHVPDEVMSLVTQSDNSMMSMRHPIQLHYEMNESSLHLLPCNCLGIISDFDLQQSIVHIITPEDLLTPEISPSGKVSLLHLLRGPMQLPSSLMYNISGQVCAPYLCRENFGEGSTALYARTNMKRRSHGK